MNDNLATLYGQIDARHKRRNALQRRLAGNLFLLIFVLILSSVVFLAILTEETLLCFFAPHAVIIPAKLVRESLRIRGRYLRNQAILSQLVRQALDYGIALDSGMIDGICRNPVEYVLGDDGELIPVGYVAERRR